MAQCTGTSKRSGVRCRDSAMRGKDKCYKHGGATPIKHGLYSKYRNPALGERIDALVRDPRIVDIKQYAARVFALLESIEHKCESLGDIDREKLYPLLKQGVDAAEKFHRLALDKRLVDIETARQLAAQIFHVMLGFIPDERHSEAVARIEELIGHDDDSAADQSGAATGVH